MWETEYNKFIAELVHFCEQGDQRFLVQYHGMGDSIRELRIYNTHYREFAQAMSQRMDRV